MSTKYDPGERRLLEDDIALTDHAIQRYRQRTPHDCSVTPGTAWRRGEFVDHPAVATSPNEDEPPQKVRVYKDKSGWGIVFLVNDADAAVKGHCPLVVVTCVNLQGFDHGPARAYLHSHGPHGGASE